MAEAREVWRQEAAPEGLGRRGAADRPPLIEFVGAGTFFFFFERSRHGWRFID